MSPMEDGQCLLGDVVPNKDRSRPPNLPCGDHRAKLLTAIQSQSDDVITVLQEEGLRVCLLVVHDASTCSVEEYLPRGRVAEVLT